MTQPCTAYFGFSVLASQFNVSFFDTSYTGTGNIISWSWDFGDSTTSNLQNPNHTYPGPGSYQVCLTITTSTGCSSTYCDRVDFLSTSCQAGFGNYGANPLQITFVDYSTSSSGTITGWTWDFGDGGSSTQSNPVHSYAAGGYYPVCLTISTTTGCMDTYCETIYVATTTSCQSSFTFQTNGSVVNFQDNSIPLNHISVWDFGDGNTVTQWNGQLVSHQYLSTGTYAVCLTITDSLCWSTSCDTIVITQSGCSAQFSSSTDSISPMNVWFTDQSVGAITNWLWDFGDGASSTIANPAHTYASVGTYRVCLTVVDTINQCSNTFCQNVYAISPCAPYFGAYPDSLIQTGVDMIFWTQSPCGTPTAIFWDFGDGTYDSTGVLNPVHTYADTGTYTVCECVVIGVDTFCNCQPVYAYRISSGIDELSSPVRSLTASPNPFRENAEIQFELSQEGKVELSVVDILGNQIEAIYKGHAAGGSHVYSVSGRGLSPGIYFIRLQVNGFAKTQKIFFLP
ncbi:MAG TPA: PKD domain-containing protein [Bacteroidia bacterium]|nr:PKD domain-containing protein [Bacteroidia bacterium]